MCGWKVTVQTRDTCASLIYKANEVELHVDVEYTKRLQLSSHMYFYCLFYCDKNDLGSYWSILSWKSNEILKLIYLCKMA